MARLLMMLDKATVLERPHDAVGTALRSLPQVIGAVIIDADPNHVAVDLRIAPPLELVAHGYPVEPVRLCILDDQIADEPLAYPLRGGLTWKHRNAIANGDLRSGSLCLWFPRDPDNLRWRWDHGLEAFIALVHRHLLAEERCRRGFAWPWEEAPHGERPDGRPHPRTGRRRTS